MIESSEDRTKELNRVKAQVALHQKKVRAIEALQEQVGNLETTLEPTLREVLTVLLRCAPLPHRNSWYNDPHRLPRMKIEGNQVCFGYRSGDYLEDDNWIYNFPLRYVYEDAWRAEVEAEYDKRQAAEAQMNAEVQKAFQTAEIAELERLSAKYGRR